MKMRKILWTVMAFLAAAGLLAGGKGGFSLSSRASPVKAAGAAPTFQGRLVPDRSVNLVFPIPGRVAEVLVEAGEVVQAGEALARLDNQEQLEAAVARAEANLLAAQQALGDLQESAAVDRTRTMQTVAQSAARVHDISSVLDAYVVRTSQQGLTPLEGAETVQSRVDAARANFSPYQFDDLQFYYTGVYNPNLPRTFFSGERVKANTVKMKLGTPTAQLAPLTLYKAVPRTISAVKLYPGQKKSLADLHPPEYYDLTPESQRIYDLKKELDTAQGEYTAALVRLKLEAGLSVAQASLEKGLKDLEAMGAGPAPDKLERAQSRVAAAQSALEAAHASLGKMSLVAPFAGTVVDVNVVPGDQVTPARVVIRMADFSRWYVETRDLTEADVVNIHVGQLTRLVADALPEVEMSGVVEEISHKSSESQGNVTYTTRVRVVQPDPRLRWGMTVQVFLQP